MMAEALDWRSKWIRKVNAVYVSGPVASPSPSNESHEANPLYVRYYIQFSYPSSKVTRETFAYQKWLTFQYGFNSPVSQTNNVVFIGLLQLPILALKGLTSLYGSRSLSCTDLINNFYQPLAQEISRWWAGAGGGRQGGGRLGGGWRFRRRG